MPRILDESYWPKDVAKMEAHWREPVEKMTYATMPAEPSNQDAVYEKETGCVYMYLVRYGAWVKSPPIFTDDADIKLKRLRRSQEIYQENILDYVQNYPKENFLSDEFMKGFREIIDKVREEQDRICR